MAFLQEECRDLPSNKKQKKPSERGGGKKGGQLSTRGARKKNPEQTISWGGWGGSGWCWVGAPRTASVEMLIEGEDKTAIGGREEYKYSELLLRSYRCVRTSTHGRQS